MSTVFDVTGITVSADVEIPVTINSVESVTIADAMVTPTVTLESDLMVSQIDVEVPGPQGPPGVQNVYVGATNPATIPGQEWGAEEINYIWIRTDV